MQPKYDENILSDLHKEAYGFRPRERYFEWWANLTVAEKNAEWDYLGQVAEDRALEEDQIHLENLQEWDKHIAALMALGADRETAVRWDMDAMEAGGDEEYYRFLWGIPYTFEANRFMADYNVRV